MSIQAIAFVASLTLLALVQVQGLAIHSRQSQADSGTAPLSTSPGPLACPNYTIASTDGSTCYTVVSANKTFIEAENFCKSLGGHLASFHNAFDNLVVNDFARKFIGIPGSYYIGGNDLLQESQWQWTDGTTFDYNDFSNNFHQEYLDCVSVSTQHGDWVQVDCYQGQGFVCSVPKTPGGIF